MLLFQAGFALALFSSSQAHANTDYNWLYHKLFSESIRQSEPQRTHKSFRVHLRDSVQQFVDPIMITRARLKPVGLQTGKMTYVGFFPKDYRYSVSTTVTGGRLLEVRVHIKNASVTEAHSFDLRLKDAARIWNTQRPALDFDYEFRFVLSPTWQGSHFSISLQDKTRGPYDSTWGRYWTSRDIAHEIGHMMGLGDEYQTLSGASDCFEPSLMCSSGTGEPMPHHYYFILRRLI
jgi:hypothetical protein